MSRRRLLLVTSAAFAVMAPLAGNAVLTHRAEQRIDRVAACRLAPVAQVSATLDSPLAAVNMLGGSVGDVDLQADGLRRNGMALHLDAHLRQVTTGGATHGGSATVTIPYPQLTKRLPHPDSGPPWTPGTDGTGLILTGTAGTLGVPVTVHTDIAVHAGTLVVTPTELTVLGRTLPVATVRDDVRDTSLAERLKPRVIRFPTLPTGVRLTGARAADDGLALHLHLASGAAGTRPKAEGACAAR
ncbi:LmeA family phospholipid-binding protein [Streptomyces sp. NPDC001796]|uniref:LmeA family phospholipid-binding protein n=1 Tax=Streptomyces sp. NPDC001796 TaxID=3364609 RepID=UPI003691985B